MIFLSPTEHDLQSIIPSTTYRISRLCEDNGADIIVPTAKGFVAYQRKTLPDLRASLTDGRLYKELAQLRSSPIIKYPFLILEYNPTRITVDGNFLDADITTETMWSLLTKVQLLGVYHLQSRNTRSTVNLITHTSKYISSKGAERLTRQRAPSSPWGRSDNRDYLIYLLQSFPGIGPVAASAIVDYFGNAPIRWSVGVKELTNVPGIGLKTAGRIHAILNSPPT